MRNTLALSFTLIFIYSTALFSQSTSTSNNEKRFVKGVVIDKEDKTGIAFALIYIEETNSTYQCDIDGKFSIENLKNGKYTFVISNLNYAEKNINLILDKSESITIELDKQSYSLDNINIMAKFSQNKGSVATIDQTSLEYIQPTSISDVFVLMPGYLYESNSMNSFSKIASRQAGADDNTSLGMSIVADGVQINNDGMRTQMAGITNAKNGDDYVAAARNPMNSGMDLRTISTDHIQSISVVRGISSAKQGNLSSGAIHINSKQGASPLQTRIKIDPLNKLIYTGKGFALSENAGTIHIGADYLSSAGDIRDPLKKYSRATAQANYNNKISLFDKSLDLNAKLSHITSLNDSKTDQLVEEYKESYKSNYNRTSLSLKGKLFINNKFIENLEFITSVDRTRDYLDRYLIVFNSTPLAMPISLTEGENEGIFIPSTYYTDYTVENVPFTFTSQLNGVSIFYPTEKFTNKILYGVEWKSVKNYGDGPITNQKRPPFPRNNSYIRTRPNHSIPALQSFVFYIEDEMNYDIGNHLLNITAGVRGTKMSNLPDNYKIGKTVLFEPRINSRFTLNSNNLSNTFRFGYGEENKLPTLDYLYPEKIYRDFVVMNAYFQDESKDRLITFTKIHDMVNPDLLENKNKKIEFGWDLDYNDFQASLTGFLENSSNGFSYFDQYYPVSYLRYVKLKHPIDKKPNKIDYEEELFKDFTSFSKPFNSESTVKKGIEYRIKLPKIDAISSNIEINGAYYSTTYSTSLPIMHRPSEIEQNKFPYVGIYEGDNKIVRDRLNTNIWINTHLPKHKIIFTNFFQFVWFSSRQITDSPNKYPSKYMDLDGTVMDITEIEINKIVNREGIWRYFDRSLSEVYYAKDKNPIAIIMNFKATKEFGKNTKLSFFVNNIIDINPKYQNTRNKTTNRKWEVAFFGAELMLNL